MTNRKTGRKGPRDETPTTVDTASEVPSTEKVEHISLAEYVARAKPRAGLVASFVYEAEKSEKGLKERSEDEWKADFEAQATRHYPSF